MPWGALWAERETKRKSLSWKKTDLRLYKTIIRYSHWLILLYLLTSYRRQQWHLKKLKQNKRQQSSYIVFCPFTVCVHCSEMANRAAETSRGLPKIFRHQIRFQQSSKLTVPKNTNHAKRHDKLCQKMKWCWSLCGNLSKVNCAFGKMCGLR